MKSIIIITSVLLQGCSVVHPVQVAFFGFENNLALTKETSPIDSSVFIPINQAFPKSTKHRNSLNNSKSQ
jgi:hypothetical protein